MCSLGDYIQQFQIILLTFLWWKKSLISTILAILESLIDCALKGYTVYKSLIFHLLLKINHIQHFPLLNPL